MVRILSWRRLTCLALTAAVFGGCSSGSGDDAGSTAVDQDIIEAVAPVSGESIDSVRKLNDDMFHMTLPGLRQCLEDRGREDLVELAVADFDAVNAGRWNAQFPETEELLESGFSGDAERSPFDDWSDMTDEEIDVALESGGRPDELVVQECRERGDQSPSVSRLLELQNTLTAGWGDVVTRVESSDEMREEYGSFGECLRGEGVPAEFTERPMDFFGWIEGRVQMSDGGGTDGLAYPEELDDARIYVSCGESLFDRREAMLRERREEFVDEHRDQIDEMVHLLNPDG